MGELSGYPIFCVKSGMERSTYLKKSEVAIFVSAIHQPYQTIRSLPYSLRRHSVPRYTAKICL
jgi:hypothetical protein